MSLASEFFAFDRALVDTGAARPLSPWWREQVGKFFADYEAGRSCEWWICAGRGSAKSYVLYKLAIFFCLYGGFDVPKSEIHYAIILSAVRKEAEKGNFLIAQWLKALGIPHRATGDVVEIPSHRVGIRVVSSNVFAASGWRALFIGADEFAKWGTDGSAMYDADEALSSAKAMTATHRRAPFIIASTPWIDSGSFYETITRGASGVVTSGPIATWDANPEALTEEDSHVKERDPRRWKREYLCEFATEFDGNFFDHAEVERATDKGRSPGLKQPRQGDSARYFIAIDPAFSHDSFAISIAHSVYGKDGAIHAIVDHLSVLTPPVGGVLSAQFCIDQVAALRRAWPGDYSIFSDQYNAVTLKEAFARCNLSLVVEPWSLQNKVTRYSEVRNLLCDRRLRLPDCPEMRREMSGVGVLRTRAGNETIESRTSHDDRVSALVHSVVTARKYPSGELLVSVGGVQVDASKMFTLPGVGLFGDYGIG